MSFDRFLAVVYSSYQDKLMRNLRYPVICTIVNYASAAILCLPMFLLMDLYDGDICIGGSFADNTIGILLKFGIVSVVLTVLPLVFLILFNTVTIVRIRRDRRVLIELNLSRTPEEEKEYWITVGSIYFCGSFLFFSCVAWFLLYQRLEFATALRRNPDQMVYYHAYVTLCKNTSVLCGVLYMTFAFVLYIIQNKSVKNTIKEVFHVLFTNSDVDINVENGENGANNVANENAEVIDPDYERFRVALNNVRNNFRAMNANANNLAPNNLDFRPPIASMSVSEFEAMNSEIIRRLEEIFEADNPQLLDECMRQLWELAISSEAENQQEVAGTSQAVDQISTRRTSQEFERQNQNHDLNRQGTNQLSVDTRTRRVAFRPNFNASDTTSNNMTIN